MKLGVSSEYPLRIRSPVEDACAVDNQRRVVPQLYRSAGLACEHSAVVDPDSCPVRYPDGSTRYGKCAPPSLESDIVASQVQHPSGLADELACRFQDEAAGVQLMRGGAQMCFPFEYERS